MIAPTDDLVRVLANQRKPLNSSRSIQPPAAPPIDPRKGSTFLQNYASNPKAAVSAHRSKICVPVAREAAHELSINRSNTPLKRQLSVNNSAFSELSTNSSGSFRSTRPPRPTRESQFKTAYGTIKNMFFKQPRLDGTLRRCQVTPPFRAKMVNWMMEVFHKFSDRTSDRTFFRAVLVMDLFLKHFAERLLTNADVYLIGLTCIFIATKYTDVEHITLAEFAHYKVSKDLPVARIRDFEFTVLTTLGFEVYFPLVCDFIDHYLQFLLEGHSSDFSERVRYLSAVVARACALDVEFNELNFEVLSLAIILTVVRHVDCRGTAGPNSLYQGRSRISVAAVEVQRNIAANVGGKLSVVEGAVGAVRSHLESLQLRFPTLDNALKLHSKFELRLLS